MLKFQLGLIVLFIGCLALISCDAIQDMLTMPADPDDMETDDGTTDDGTTDDGTRPMTA